jgi:hypothetical protein
VLVPPSSGHVVDQDLTQYVCEHLDSKRSLYIRSHILECNECQDRLVTKALAQLAELNEKQPIYKNREPRFGTNLSATLQTLSPLSSEQVDAEIVNESRGGYSVRIASFIEAGTIVQLRIGTATPIGMIRYCREYQGEYIAGVQIQRTDHRTQRF